MGGPVIDRYELGESLGSGVCGEVFRARTADPPRPPEARGTPYDRTVAFKRFLPLMPSTGIAAAARGYGLIDHPRVARLIDHGDVDGARFTAVELVEGATFDRVLAATFGANRPLPSGAALGMVSRVARAIAYTHGRGVLHLGLCPTNVICTEDGEVKVCDFGFLPLRLAAARGKVLADPALTARIAYLAPEQLAVPTPETFTAAVDIFVLGALAIEALTGARAFGDGTSQAVAGRIKQGAAGLSWDGIAPPLAETLKKALAVEPGDRYATIEELADALEAAMRAARTPGGRSDVAIAVRRLLKQRGSLSRHATPEGEIPATNPPRLEPARDANAPAPPHEEPTAVESRTVPIPGPGRAGPMLKAIPPTVRVPEAPAPANPEKITSPIRIARPEEAPGDANAPQPIAGTDATERNLARGPRLLPRRPLPAPVDRHKRPTLPGMPPIDKSAGVPQKVAERAPSEPTVDGKGRPVPAEAFRPADSAPTLRVTEPADSKEPTPVHDTDVGRTGRLLKPTEPGIVPTNGRTAAAPDLPLPAPPLTGPTLRAPTQRTPEPPPLPPLAAPDVPTLAAPADAPALADVAPVEPEPQPVTTTTILTTSTVGRRLVFVALLLAVLVGAYFAWQEWGPEDTPATVPEITRDAGRVAAVVHPDARSVAVVHPDAGSVAVVHPDAGSVAVVHPDASAVAVVHPDAGAAVKPPIPTGDGKLAITSTPAGATVYVDGAAKGQTPLELPAIADHLHLVLVLPGYHLHRADIDGGKPVAVTLQPVTPSKAPAGIKVNCASRGRLYIIVDGEDTGKLCPNDQRIPVAVGEHTVDLYDPVNDTTSKHTVNVAGTHFSARLNVKE